MRIVEDQRDLGGRERPAHEGTAAIGERCPGADTVARIVVAGDQDDRGVGLRGHALEESIELADGGLGRCRPIEDIAGNDQDVGLVRCHRSEDLVQSRRVIEFQRAAFELPPEVPVGRVQYPHKSLRTSSF